MTFKLENDVRELRAYSRKAQELVTKKIMKKPTKELKNSIYNFMDFFVVPPVDIDPYGIIRKLEHVMDEGEDRFKYFVNQLAPKENPETKADIIMGVKGALGTTQIYKIIRHYVITIKKTNNLQLAMILQMTMPMLMKIAKSQLKATKAFVDGIPIGDGIGPLVVASYKTKKGKEISEDVIMSKEKVGNKEVYLIKAAGPGGRLGKLGIGIRNLVKKEKIDHIITIDAGAKLEGERTGSIAEGVGVAMGGIGVDKSYIENVAIENNIPLDAIVIKVSIFEASEPMTKKIYNSLENSRKILEKKIRESKYKKILVIGVGNTCGIDNEKDKTKNLSRRLKPVWKKQKIEKLEEEKKRKRFLGI